MNNVMQIDSNTLNKWIFNAQEQRDKCNHVGGNEGSAWWDGMCTALYIMVTEYNKNEVK